MANATRAAFIRWLAGLADDEFVGYRLQCTTCPLATFLESLEPGCMPHIERRTWARWEGEPTRPWRPNARPWRPMPDWALRVIDVADNLDVAMIYADQLRAALSAQLGWRFG